MGKYTAKKGVDGVDGMIHKVFKLAKHYQPSVIFIGDAASIFLKKKPKVMPLKVVVACQSYVERDSYQLINFAIRCVA